MKESIIVLFFFSFGVLGGRLDLLPADWLGLVHEASNLAVYAMLSGKYAVVKDASLFYIH